MTTVKKERQTDNSDKHSKNNLAKVFMSGNSQAVRLPKALRFDADIDTLEIQKVGDSIMLTPTHGAENNWAKRVNAVFDTLANSHDKSDIHGDTDLLMEVEDLPPQQRPEIHFHQDWAEKGWEQ